MKPLVEVEFWTSSQNRHEKHYFIRDGRQHAYQDGAYLFGVNPSLVSPEQEAEIVKILEPIWRQ